MATCKRIEVMPTPPPVEYALTMSEDEARLLSQLLRMHVAGDACEPLFQISQALRKAGVSPSHLKIRHRKWCDDDSVLLVEAA